VNLPFYEPRPWEDAIRTPPPSSQSHAEFAPEDAILNAWVDRTEEDARSADSGTTQS
jgi:hypothetical protein